MICLSLAGGLGNQLFQLGAALRLARGNTKYIKLDVTDLGGRAYELPKIIPERLLPARFSDDEVKQFKSVSPVYVIPEAEGGYFSDQKLLDLQIDFSSTNIFLRGYFQSWRNVSELKKYLNLHNSAFLNYNSLMPIEDRVIIHYRQGDYLKLNVQHELGLLNLSYIDRAIYNLKNKYDLFEIHSEEVGLLAAYKEKKGVKVIIDSDSIATFQTFLSAKTIVIPNSSFSLCAAYLSPFNALTLRPAVWSRKYVADDLTTDFPSTLMYLSNSFYPATQ